MNEIVQKFKQLGQKASYHFADDTGKEWDAGYAAQRKAEELFDQHPALQEEMRTVAKGFLWTLNK